MYAQVCRFVEYIISGRRNKHKSFQIHQEFSRFSTSNFNHFSLALSPPLDALDGWDSNLTIDRL